MNCHTPAPLNMNELENDNSLNPIPYVTNENNAPEVMLDCANVRNCHKNDQNSHCIPSHMEKNASHY
jgi:hypothetical protein